MSTLTSNLLSNVQKSYLKQDPHDMEFIERAWASHCARVLQLATEYMATWGSTDTERKSDILRKADHFNIPRGVIKDLSNFIRRSAKPNKSNDPEELRGRIDDTLHKYRASLGLCFRGDSSGTQ